VLETAEVVGAGDAVFIVAVDLQRRTARVADRNKTALPVGVQPS
jgi:hypothetical protein